MHPDVSQLFSCRRYSKKADDGRGFDCNDVDGNQRFATTEYDGTTLSAPAFEIRWRSEDLKTDVGELPAPSMTKSSSYRSSPATPLTFSTLASAGASDTPAPDPTIIENDTASNIDEPQPSKSTLNKESIAGIAVGASLGTLGMTMSVFYLTIRRRRRKSRGSQGSTRDSWYQSSHFSPVGPAVVEGQPPAEMAHQPVGPRELDSSAIYSDDKGAMFRPETKHVSLNSVPIEMAAEPLHCVKK